MRIFEKLATYNEHPTSKQNAEIDSLITENFTLEVVFEKYVAMRTLWYIIIMLIMYIAVQ